MRATHIALSALFDLIRRTVSLVTAKNGLNLYKSGIQVYFINIWYIIGPIKTVWGIVMIETIGQFLEQLLKKEREALKKYNILQHGPMIGDMYEGLTRAMLEKACFGGLGISVKTGKILGSTGELSKQIDAMVVIGEGEKIPYTDNYIYPLSQVIAVVEVKKNLYSDDLRSAYTNLSSVKFEEERVLIDSEMVRDAYKLIAQADFMDVEKLPFDRQQILRILGIEAALPVRITLGYDGFASEYSLRESLLKFIESHGSENYKGLNFGPVEFPNLIICGESSLIKLNGMPFGAALMYEDLWPFYASYFTNPVIMLLEVIWTRLTYMFKISSSIFGEDLEIEAVAPLLFAQPRKVDTGVGWYYTVHDLDDKTLRRREPRIGWQPEELDDCIGVVLMMLGNKGEIDINDSDFINFLERHEYKVNDFLRKIQDIGLVYLDGSKLKYLTEECTLAFLPNGKVVAAENKTGRFANWTFKEIKKNKEK